MAEELQPTQRPLPNGHPASPHETSGADVLGSVIAAVLSHGQIQVIMGLQDSDPFSLAVDRVIFAKSMSTPSAEAPFLPRRFARRSRFADASEA